MKSLQSGWMAGCLLLAFLASNASAAVIYWDPQAKNSGGPFGDLWENADWSSGRTGSTTPVVWSEVGNAAGFAVGTSGSTPAFTVTMNATHTVAGIFNGNIHTPCTVTINGSGTMIMPASTAQGFYTASPGITTIGVPLAGSGSEVVLEDNGQFV